MLCEGRNELCKGTNGERGQQESCFSTEEKKDMAVENFQSVKKKISASCLVCGGFCTFCSPEGTDIIPENNEFCAFPQEAFSSASDTETEK